MNEVQILGITMFLAGLLSYGFRNKKEFRRGLRVGFRIPYTLASQEAWRAGNTFVGIGFMALGVLVIFLSFSLSENQAVLIATFGGFVIIALGAYVSKIALERETFKPAEGEIKPLKEFNVKPWLFSGALIMIIYLLIALYYYPKLPEVIAIHFTSSGAPDSFGSKLPFVLIVPLTIMSFFLGLIYLAKEPFKRAYISIYSKNPEQTRKWTLNLLLAGMFVQFIAYTDIIWFSLNGAHLLSISSLTTLSLLFIAIPSAMILLSLFRPPA
ncbi:hypothetical protein PAP_10030 [Palaeococcus pacificus DY20341]|uniref:DUF1648 domain-containing protein n=1 Tax=Palaeococcus pacificus DY20341 TaxID=1343739 RepID=A0A075LUI0_9EURY|nr:DUF1648 domain-containing protein [Palaeococcus pacificus]AIF70380.1 hypothetical protein PAP_10030 [Palaeococcus pacificus DY20341]